MIAIVGCGTLGSRLATLLSEHELLLVDHDIVSEENLSTQAFTEEELGATKADALGKRLEKKAIATFLDRTNLDLLSEAEAVCDCTDNMLTRILLNRWCLRNGVPLVHAAAGKQHGVAAAFTGKPCLECVYGGKVPVEDCRGRDIDPALADRIAQRQALLTKMALDDSTPHSLFLITADGEQEIRNERSCPVCETRADIPTEEYYITWCVQASCLSAKPVREHPMRMRTERFGDIEADVLGNGEIHFFGSEDTDALARIAQRIYARR